MPVVPTGGSMGPVQEVVKQLQQQSQQSKSPEQSFDKVLQKGAQTPGITEPGALAQVQPQQQVSQVQNLTQTSPVNQVDQINKAQKAAEQKVQSAQKTQPGSSSPLKSLLETYNSDSSSMSNLMKVAMNGQSFSPSQLLLLQSASFKITFELQAIDKLVETASGAVKTTMQTQV